MSTEQTTVTLVMPAVIANVTGGERERNVNLPAPATIKALLDQVSGEFPVFGRRVRNEVGEIRRYVNIFLGKRNIRNAQGQDTVLTSGDRVTIVQSVAGG